MFMMNYHQDCRQSVFIPHVRILDHSGTTIRVRGRPAEPDFFCRAPWAYCRKMTVNKALAHTEIGSETKFHSIWSNGSEVMTIYAYLVNHTCERSR